MPPACEHPCSPVCDRAVFDRVHVTYLVRGGTTVMWDLVPEFTDALPHAFQLQVSETGTPDADDWADVGLPVTDSFYAVDDSQRVFGQQQTAAYRVQLITNEATYYSAPTGVMGVLTPRDWRFARELVRQERVLHRHDRVSVEGYLLKRRRSGPRCDVCLDVQTKESRRPDCPVCYGTGWQCGYYFPYPCVYAGMAARQWRTMITLDRATVSDMIIPSRMLQVPLLDAGDVFVARKTDERFFVHRISGIQDVRGVPIVANVELRSAPFSDPIYDVPIPQQLEAIDAWTDTGET